MIENLRRRPGSPGEWAADLVRVAGAVSVVFAALVFGWTDAGVVALAVPGTVIPRLLDFRPAPDLAFTITLLIASWSNVFDLYTDVAGWDLVVHFVATGLLSLGSYYLIARGGVLADPAERRFSSAQGVLITTVIGLALSAVWEMIEWFGKTFVDDDIFVTYDDTIGDMAVGGLGALVAGLCVAFVPIRRRPRRAARREKTNDPR